MNIIIFIVSLLLGFIFIPLFILYIFMLITDKLGISEYISDIYHSNFLIKIPVAILWFFFGAFSVAFIYSTLMNYFQ